MRERISTICAIAAFLSLAISACAHRSAGRFVVHELESEAEGRTLAYGVYLPPPGSWDGTDPLPLVILLHGAGDDERSADRRCVVDALDEAVLSGDVPPFILVAPRGELGFWTNWADGSHRFRDWVLDEVVPDVRARLPIEEGSLHLVGVSMGGGGGLQMWLAERERFSSATILSAPILDADEARRFLGRFIPEWRVSDIFGDEDDPRADPYAALVSEEDLAGSPLVFGAARRDRVPIVGSNERFHEHLEGRGVPHAYLSFRGRHGWKAWARALPVALGLQLDASD